jgi:hypothetical protein
MGCGGSKKIAVDRDETTIALELLKYSIDDVVFLVKLFDSFFPDEDGYASYDNVLGNLGLGLPKTPGK